MEDLCRKIPLISKSIFEELDDQSFVNLKDASREIETTLKNERFYWIRVLRSYNCLFKDFKDSWSRVLNRTPAEFVRKIVVLIDHFYKDDCYTEDKTFFSPQHIAACLGKLELYNYFVMRTGVINPKEPIQIHDYGDTLFHLAARRGYLAICKYFVENLQDKNPVNNAGYTPLHRAARRGHLNICKLIIQNVQNKNPESNDRNTPLHSAAERGQIDVCKLIIENMQKETLGSNQVQTPIQRRRKQRGRSRHRKEKRSRNRSSTIGGPPRFLDLLPPPKLIIVNPMNRFGYTPVDMAKRFGHHKICQYINSVVKKENPAVKD